MTKTPTVLIIEDDPVFRRVLSFTVAKMGLAVEVVGDGEAGYERLLRGGIDFMVTDHQMPLCGGVELLRRLQSLADYSRPPAILCTAKGLELDSESLRQELSLVTVMHKPFSPRRLSELILEHLENNTPATPDAGDPSGSRDPLILPPSPSPVDPASQWPPQGCGDG